MSLPPCIFPPASRYFLVLHLLLVVGSMGVFAQDRHLRFEHLGAEQGLSHSSVSKVLQDSQGFLWVGTLDGLNRYDGYEVQSYKRDPRLKHSLPDNAIQDLALEGDNHLWVATRGAGIAVLNFTTNQFSHFRAEPGSSERLCQDNVRSLLFDSDGNLWAGTHGGGICRLDKGTTTFRHYRQQGKPGFRLSNNLVNDLLIDEQGFIWAACEGSISRINPKTNEIKNYPMGSTVFCLYRDSKKKLWAGTSAGLMLHMAQSDNFVAASGVPLDAQGRVNPVTALVEDQSGRFWLGTRDSGFIRYSRELNAAQVFRNDPLDLDSLSSDAILSLFVDRTGVLWIGTLGGWLNKLNLNGLRFRHYRQKPGQPDSLSNNNVRSLLRTKAGVLWAGTVMGLNRVEGSGFRQYSHDPEIPSSLAGNRIYALNEDRDGRLWVGSDSGLSMITVEDQANGTKKFRNFRHVAGDESSLSQNHVRCMTFDHRNRLWVGTKGGGLNLLENEDEGFQHFRSEANNPKTPSHDFIYKVYEDVRGYIWLGTLGGGLNRFDTEKVEFTYFLNDAERNDSLSNNRVFSLTEDADGQLWVGTGSGLSRHNRQTDTFSVFFPGDYSGSIYSVVADHAGLLWLATSKGIIAFNSETEDARSFGLADGLQGNVFSLGASFQSPDGEIYFGGINGFNAFYPRLLGQDPYPPQMSVTQLSINHQRQLLCRSSNGNVVLEDGSNQLVLAHNDDVVSFSFSGMHYANPSGNRFAWRMDGLDREWTFADAHQRVANFTGIPAGDYSFRVKGANGDGVWGEGQLQLKITKLRPIWLGNMALLGYLLGFIMLVFLLVKTTERVSLRKGVVLEEQNRLLEAAVEDRTVKLRQAHKELLEVAHQSGMAEIATSVLHNVGNVLNSVNVSGQFLEKHMRESRMSERLHRANQLLDDMLISGIKPGDPKAVELCKYFKMIETRLRKDQQTAEDDLERMLEGIMLIKKIVKSQQSYASIGLLEEEDIPLDRVVRDALGILDASLARHGVEVVFKSDTSVHLAVQRTKLIHVVLNLIKNAKEAMELCDKKTLTIVVEKWNGFGYLSFCDSGMGIESDKLNSVFNQGYTTKKGGHGFGLHSCANSMTEMGGVLWAESDGPGMGATFCLKFPLEGAEQGMVKVVSKEKDRPHIKLRAS